MKYADRKAEFNLLDSLIHDNVKVIFINTSNSTGFTSFLREKFAEYKTYHIEYTQKANYDLAENLFCQLHKEDLIVLQRLIDKNYGEYEVGILSSLAEGIIPYFGRTLSILNEGKKGRCLYDANYAFFFSLLPDMFNIICKNQKIGIFIDGAQYIDQRDYLFVMELSKIDNLYFVFGMTQESNDIYKLTSDLNFNKIKNDKMAFSEPTEELVIELAAFFNKSLSLDDAKDVLENCNYNIYKIRAYLQEGLIPPAMNPISKAIICVYSIIPNNVNVKTIKNILLTDKTLINVTENFDLSLNMLIENEILEIQNGTLVLIRKEDKKIKDLIENSSNILYYKHIIYNYYKELTIYSLDELEFVYSLAAEYDNKQSDKWLYQITYLRLQLGLTIEKNLINALRNSENVKLLIIVYTYNRNYESALKYIIKLKENEKLSFNFKKLYAVLLNRCRLHNKAEKKLLNCLKKEPNNFIIMSYLASNYIHQEKLSEAKKLYKNIKLCNNTIDKGYFYRNIAAAFWDNKEPFEEALKIFEKLNDSFGYYTTLCNYVTRKILWNQYENAEEQFILIEKNLNRYGGTNLHVLYNNWGIFYLVTGDTEKARKQFDVALSFSKNNMPAIFIQINQACLELQCGEKEQAKFIIDSIKDAVEKIPVNRVKQKYYINKALIYYANGKEIEGILEQCNCYPERYNPNYTFELIHWYQFNQENAIIYKDEYWNKAYCPCYLEYWYVNPLKLFSETILNEILPI